VPKIPFNVMSSFPELPGILEQPVVEEAVLDDTGLSLVVHNDEVNTFDWVIESLVKICRHSMEQAEQCAYIIHFNGKYAVKHGEERELNPMRRGLVDRGINATLE
jgi:ATP-dependent Clp protease adaptor protein ClpS